MLTAIYIPRSTTASPQYVEGFSRADLPETPANGLPVRVMLGGSVLSRDDFTVTGNELSIPGDWTTSTLEVDYYLISYVDLGQRDEQGKPDLPDIELYSLSPAGHSANATNGEGFDLLLQMVDDSEYDLGYDGLDLTSDNALHSAIIMSVYSDALVDGQRGWWGDTYTGDYPVADCKLWTLMGKRTTHDNVLRGDQYIKAAVQWLIDDGHFDAIDVTTEHHPNNLDWLAFRLRCRNSGVPDTVLNLNLG